MMIGNDSLFGLRQTLAYRDIEESRITDSFHILIGIIILLNLILVAVLVASVLISGLRDVG
jgi:hypothetical protein